MQAMKVQTTLTEDGTITLSGLPYRAGDRVEVIVLANGPKAAQNAGTPPHPLHGAVYRYDDPFEPVALDDWEALQ